METITKIQTTRNYINGKWQDSRGTQSYEMINPATGENIGKTVFSTQEEVDLAVKAAREAFPEWRGTPPRARARYMFKLKDLLEERFEDLSRVCSLECGKTLEESRGEVRRGIEVVELMTSAPSLMKGQSLEDIAAGL